MNNTAHQIRLMATAIVIAEYALIGLVDGTKQDLRVKVQNAINSCRRVQDWFITHPNSKPEVSTTFKQQFLGDEIVLLSELLTTCFGMDAEGLEEIIKAIKQNTTNETVA